MKMKSISALLLLAISASALAADAMPLRRGSGGQLVHKFSGVVLPPRVGLFTRGDQQFFDPAGRDVRMRYILDHLIWGDVYVYPVGPQRPDLNTEFKIQLNAIQRLNRNVTFVARETVRINQNGRAITGQHANCELQRELFGERNRKCGSQFYVFRDGPWFVAYRFSYPKEKSAIALKHISDFLTLWNWKPERQVASSDTHP
jgi:hypothetical protein